MSEEDKAIDAPWQAKIFSTLVSQGGLFFSQYVLWKTAAGPNYTLALAGLQCIQGSISAYGMKPWAAASTAAERFFRAIRRRGAE